MVNAVRKPAGAVLFPTLSKVKANWKRDWYEDKHTLDGDSTDDPTQKHERMDSIE
jgi:hypothetical protein